MSEENTLDGLSILSAEDAPIGSLPSSISGSSRDALLDRYLAEVGCYPVLDPETERQLAELYVRTGDRHAADQLITANLRLVVKMATQYRWQWARLLDLIQEGNTGLMIALSRFDPARGVPFGRYAAYWIRAMILRYLSANYRLVDMGSGHYARKLFFRLNKERARLQEAGITPTTRALAEAFGVPESAVRDIDRFLRAPAVSLQAPLDGDDGSPLELLLSDSRTLSPEQIAADNEWRELVYCELDSFGDTLEDDREQIIWQQRLRSPAPVSLSELGHRFGVSKQRVSQVENRIKRRLKATLSEGIGSELESVLCDPPGWSSHVRGTRNIELP
ncbi:MAG: RNA polymerase sigma-32 factor [Myxococcota bacterium]|jgi:RNA polymerase sigma-32 factor